MTPTQRKAMEQAVQALRQTEEYLRIEASEARARDANINTINNWNEELNQHREAITSLTDALAEPAPEPVPLLTDDEINDIYDEVARREPYSGAVTRRNIARTIESLVHQKAGL